MFLQRRGVWVDVIGATPGLPSQAGRSIMMNIIAACLLAVTVQTEPAEPIQLMSAEAPKAYRLGAGDRLGREVFDNYKTFVRAQQQERRPRLAASDSNWIIGVRLGDRVIRIECVDGKHRVVHERNALPLHEDNARRSTL
jgi:hypothetical protein